MTNPTSLNPSSIGRQTAVQRFVKSNAVSSESINRSSAFQKTSNGVRKQSEVVFNKDRAVKMLTRKIRGVSPFINNVTPLAGRLSANRSPFRSSLIGSSPIPFLLQHSPKMDLTEYVESRDLVALQNMKKEDAFSYISKGELTGQIRYALSMKYYDIIEFFIENFTDLFVSESQTKHIKSFIDSCLLKTSHKQPLKGAEIKSLENICDLLNTNKSFSEGYKQKLDTLFSALLNLDPFHDVIMTPVNFIK